MNINMSVFAGDPGWIIFGRVFFFLSILAMPAAVLIYGFKMGFKTLKLDQNVFSIKLAPLTVLAEKDPAFLLEAMGCLVDLVKDFPRSDPKD